MAVITVFEDILDKVSNKVNVDSGKSVKDFTCDYIKENIPDIDLKEVYYPATGETKLEGVESDGFGITVIVNGECSDIDYTIKEDDLITLIITPYSKGAANDIIEVSTGVVAFVGGLFVAGAGIVSGAWVPAAIGAILASGGAYLVLEGAGVIGDRNKKSKKKGDEEDSESLLSIDGGSNQNIIDKRYPIVIGEHLINPLIVGNGWHETFTHFENVIEKADNKNYCKDSGQYYNVLYCLGYGPLKVTDIKLKNIILAYNRSRVYGDGKQTVLHGRLKGWNDADTGDILKKWKNNDVELEILQAGDFEKYKDKWGSIYNQTVKEDNIENANILFAYDKSIQSNDKDSISYKGVEVPCGYRTNTVRFSDSCPMKIQVELDMPAGYYSTRVKSTEDSSCAYYNIMPISLAVQWRFSKPNELPSDAESPYGWNNFDYCLLEAEMEDGRIKTPYKIYPSLYTSEDRNLEIDSNFGLTSGTSKTGFNENWINSEVFKLHNDYSTDMKIKMTAQEISAAIESGDLEITGTSEGRVQKVRDIREEPFSETYEEVYDITEYKSNVPGIVIVEEQIPQRETKSVYIGPNKVGMETYTVYKTEYIPYKVVSNITQDNFKVSEYNINERRYVFEKTFSDEECRKFLTLSTGKAEVLILLKSEL